MKPDAKIKTTDLEAALDYLEGLSFIVRSFDESSRGREGRDILLEGLQAMDSGAMSWKPLLSGCGRPGVGCHRGPRRRVPSTTPGGFRRRRTLIRRRSRKVPV